MLHGIAILLPQFSCMLEAELRVALLGLSLARDNRAVSLIIETYWKHGVQIEEGVGKYAQKDSYAM